MGTETRDTQEPTSTDAGEEPRPERKPPHPIALAASKFLHAARDVEDCVNRHVSAAVQEHQRALEALMKSIENQATRETPVAEGERGAWIRWLFDSMHQVERGTLSDPGHTLRAALFLRLFAAFDTFIGNLVAVLFERKPDLFFKLGGEVKIAVVLKTSDFDAFKRAILNDYIDSLHRSSYSEQFRTLEKLSDISTLTGFANWSQFVEVAQRRNLFAHCDGVVSEQYTNACRNASLSVKAKVGERLTLDDPYILNTSRLLMEVALKLAQTLWRKLLPSELSTADAHLHEVGYQALQLQEWEWAAKLGEFASGLPRHANEIERLIALINQAIAVKHLAGVEATSKLLDSVDWSATAMEFKLAVAVLLERYDEAAALMRRIGPKGEILEEHSYHTWPLFREFRGTPEFLDAYQAIYGYAFAQDLKPDTSRLERLAAGKSDAEAPVASAPQAEGIPHGQEERNGKDA